MDELRKRLSEVYYLSSILNLLNWDQEVNMPHRGSGPRSISIAHLSGIVHNKFVALDKGGVLTNLKRQLDAKKLKGKDAVIVYETWRSFDRERKLPEKFVREMAEITSKAQNKWAEAREKNDFSLFLPWLKKIVSLKRKEAELVGYTDSPYDALLDAYEPDMTSKEVSRILDDLKDFLVPFLKRIKESKIKIDDRKLSGHFPIEKQVEFNEMIARKMGFDLESGRLDKSTHPFTSGFHPNDVRITTRYSEKDIFYSIGSTIHESGHALYDQGLPEEHFGTPLAESVSLGIHESQSRLWENNVGKDKPFWKYFYPKLQKEFPKPFKSIPTEAFYKAINAVKPSLIRTQADEVTYNLHIIIRFEIEKEMIEGSIDLAKLPEIWCFKMKKYLGIDVPTDKEGVLQDVHWSAGLIGYFPTYSLGNLYAAQLYATMNKQIPRLSNKIAGGHMEEVKNWLRKNVHIHGKTYSAQELIRKITGEYLNSRYFNEYLEKKYGEIYKLEKLTRKSR